MSSQSHKNLLWLILLTIFTVLSLFLAIHNSYYTERIEKEMQLRINKYQQAIKDVEVKLGEDDRELMNELYKLRFDWTNEKIELETRKEYVDRQIFRIYAIGSSILICGSLGIIGWLKYLINKSLYEHISSLTNENKELIKNVIEYNKNEKKLKKESKILLLALEKESNEDVEKFLQQVGFEKITSKVTSDSCILSEYDLVILNRMNDFFKKEQAEEIVDNNSDIKFFDYVSSNHNWINNKKENILNRANSKITLYRNLLDTLMIHDKIKLTQKNVSQA